MGTGIIISSGEDPETLQKPCGPVDFSLDPASISDSTRKLHVSVGGYQLRDCSRSTSSTKWIAWNTSHGIAQVINFFHSNSQPKKNTGRAQTYQACDTLK